LIINIPFRCACDISGHLYTWSFEPNPTCSTTYIGTDEIQNYFSGFAEKYGLRKDCQFKKRVSRAEWDNDKGQWKVEVVDLETGATIQDWCHFLISATGVLNAWKWPDVPGIDKFEGKIFHTANYDRDLDLTDKNVALIGNGYVIPCSRHRYWPTYDQKTPGHQAFKFYQPSYQKSKKLSLSTAPLPG
jgi:cation diffusion facilitator CzcD-associated flavoprotein CzcO